MKIRQWITAIVLLLLVAAAIAGMVWTRALPPPSEDTTATGAAGKKGGRNSPAPRALVDQRPLQTARAMAAMAGSPEEQALAHEAEKVGDHEVDLAFFDALRTAQQNPPPLSAEAKQIAARKIKAEQTLKDDQENIGLLTRKLATAPDAQKDNLQDQIDVAKAQMDLDQDELDDASEDLEQAGGDPQSKIKRLQEEHEAGDHNVAPAGSAVNPHEQDFQARTWLSVFRAWQALREKKSLLQQARAEAVTKQVYLSKKKADLAAQVAKDQENREAAKQQAKGFASVANAASAKPQQMRAAMNRKRRRGRRSIR